MLTVYCVGNPLLNEDRLPLQIMDRLREEFPHIHFKELDPSENMPEEKELIIIDTVIGTEKVKVLENIDAIVTGKVYSLHDFDLGFTLKLMKKAGKLEKIKIICIPASMKEEDAFKDVSKELRLLIKNFFSDKK